MIHVGMTDENGGDGFQDPLRQVVYASAVKKHGSSQGPDVYLEHRIVKEPGKEGRFE
jgi:hypothetical protein